MTNKQILQAANEAITKGDYEVFLFHCSDDTRWEFVGDQVLDGKEAVRRYMASEYLEPPRFEVEHLVAEDDFVTAIGNITIKDKEGTLVRHAYCDVWRFRDGKMCALQAFVIAP